MTRKRSHLLLSLLVIVIFAGNVIGTYNALTRPYPGHNDFLSRWEGARSFWVDGLNPYGAEASLNIQERIYGRAVVEGEDPGFFAYPFYTVFLLLPISFMSYSWASAIWMVLLEFCLLGAFFLLLDTFSWRPKPLLLGLLALWMLLSYFPSRGLLLGQPGHLVYFLEIFTLWALWRKSDRGAGFTLALSTIKPQMGYLLVPLLLLWGLREKRWQFVGGFVVTFGVLMLASFLFVPTWMSDWLAQVALYPGYTEIGSPVWVVANLPWLGVNPDSGRWEIMGGFGATIKLIADIALYGWMFWSWYTVLIQRKTDRWWWVVALTLTVTHLVAPRTATPHFVVFILPLIFWLRELTRRVRGGTAWAMLILIALFVGQWAHFLLTVEGEFEHPTLYFPTPFAVLILLWLTRRLWWERSPALDKPA